MTPYYPKPFPSYHNTYRSALIRVFYIGLLWFSSSSLIKFHTFMMLDTNWSCLSKWAMNFTLLSRALINFLYLQISFNKFDFRWIQFLFVALCKLYISKSSRWTKRTNSKLLILFNFIITLSIFKLKFGCRWPMKMAQWKPSNLISFRSKLIFLFIIGLISSVWVNKERNISFLWMCWGKSSKQLLNIFGNLAEEGWEPPLYDLKSFCDVFYDLLFFWLINCRKRPLSRW